MVKRYKNKPVEIEAEQFIIWDYNKVPEYVECFGQRFIVKGKGYYRYIEIPSDIGIVRAYVNDYIVRESNGELYSCKEKVFKFRYEESPQNIVGESNKHTTHEVPVQEQCEFIPSTPNGPCTGEACKRP